MEPARPQGLMIGLTLLAGALFKLSAFVREAFITSHFGLTPVTDTYFSLQQLPLTLATFMLGAFSRAFSPAYADSLRENERTGWLSGLLFYSTLASVLLTAAALHMAPAVLSLFAIRIDRENVLTLGILTASFLPIVFIGVCSAIWMSYGRSLGSLTLAGVPYLVMTLSLVGIYFAGWLGDLSLPISMTLGFCIVGAYSLVAIFAGEKAAANLQGMLTPWRSARFQQFIHQLAASSLETLGYSTSQFIMLYFVARAGTGAVSANNCATRIGMLGFSFLSLPLTQVMQARMCTSQTDDRENMAKKYLMGMALVTCLFAAALYFCRLRVTELIYLRGNFSRDALDQVVEMLPAWLGYFVVLSMNAVTARYLFTVSRGARYTRNMLCGYLLTNGLRLLTAGRVPAPWIVWCAVVGEGCAFAFNLQACIIQPRCRVPLVAIPQPQEMSG